MSNLKTLAFRSIAVAGLAAGMTGCVIVDSRLESGTRLLSTAAEDTPAFEVRTANGSVVIEQAEISEIQVKAEIKARTFERLDATSIVIDKQYGPDGPVIAVYPLWPDGGRKNNEACSFVILTPSAYGASVDTSNGSVKLIGLAGRADVDTSNGSITITDHDGSLWAESSNGRITVDGISGPVDATSSNGRMEITLDADNPGPVDLSTSNGRVELTVGSSFEGGLRLSTSNGSIDLEQLIDRNGGIRLTKLGKRSAEISLGDSDQLSTIRTSNGSITVRQSDDEAAHRTSTERNGSL